MARRNKYQTMSFDRMHQMIRQFNGNYRMHAILSATQTRLITKHNTTDKRYDTTWDIPSGEDAKLEKLYRAAKEKVKDFTWKDMREPKEDVAPVEIETVDLRKRMRPEDMIDQAVKEKGIPMNLVTAVREGIEKAYRTVHGTMTTKPENARCHYCREDILPMTGVGGVTGRWYHFDCISAQLVDDDITISEHYQGHNVKYYISGKDMDKIDTGIERVFLEYPPQGYSTSIDEMMELEDGRIVVTVTRSKSCD